MPGSELIAELAKVRTAALHRLSDEGLSDVEMTNASINALRYREDDGCPIARCNAVRVPRIEARAAIPTDTATCWVRFRSWRHERRSSMPIHHERRERSAPARFGYRVDTMRRSTRWLRAGVGILIGLLAVVFALPWLVRRELPPLRGPHGVGTGRLVVAGNEGRRDVPLQVWYPCAVGARGERAPYVAQPERVGPALIELLGLPAIASPIAVRMLDFRTRSFLHCDPQGSHLPLVFFSHGLGGFEGQDTYLAEELASRGAVVLAVNHADSSFSVFPDGHLDFGFRRLKGSALTDEAKAQLVRDRARDVERVLDAAEHGALKLGAIPLSTLADFSGTTIFGHSLGGATAIRVAEMDARVRLAVDLDGVSYEDEATGPLDRPIVVVQTDAVAPSDLRRSRRPPAAWEAYRRRRETTREVLGRRLTTWGRVISVSGVHHLDFTDLPLIFPAARHVGLLGRNGAALQRWLVQLLVTAMRPQVDAHRLLPDDAQGLVLSVSSLGLP